jgi:hypothetical protein
MLDTNSMVEEFMLLANISVADHIFKHFPECAVLRRHPVPPASNFEPFLKAGKTQVGFLILLLMTSKPHICNSKFNLLAGLYVRCKQQQSIGRFLGRSC